MKIPEEYLPVLKIDPGTGYYHPLPVNHEELILVRTEGSHKKEKTSMGYAEEFMQDFFILAVLQSRDILLSNDMGEPPWNLHIRRLPD